MPDREWLRDYAAPFGEQSAGALEAPVVSLVSLEAKRKRTTTSMANLALQLLEGLPVKVQREAMAALVAKHDSVDEEFVQLRGKVAAPAATAQVAAGLLENLGLLTVAHRREMPGRLFSVTVDFAVDRTVDVRPA